jgi:uncharacterized delta-60 repeat protein
MDTSSISLQRRPGDLDTQFGENGTVLPGGGRTVSATTIEPHSGKTLGTVTGTLSFTLFRLNLDGSLDASFGSNGTVEARFAAVSETQTPTLIRVLADGKIFLAGNITRKLEEPKPAAALFNSDGSIVSSFGEQGAVVLDISPTPQPTPLTPGDSPSSDFVFSYRGMGTLRDHAVVICLTAQGALDVRFATRGYLAFKLHDLWNTTFTHLQVRNDGVMILAGYSSHGAVVAAITARGEWHARFNEGSVLLPDRDMQLHTVAVYGDHRVLCVGYREGVCYLTRLTADATPDLQFNGGNPLLIENRLGALALKHVHLLADERFVLAGNIGSSTLPDGCIYRRAANGGADSTFGNEGHVERLGLTIDNLAVQADGNIVIAGHQTNVSAVQRYRGA